MGKSCDAVVFYGFKLSVFNLKEALLKKFPGEYEFTEDTPRYKIEKEINNWINCFNTYISKNLPTSCPVKIHFLGYDEDIDEYAVYVAEPKHGSRLDPDEMKLIQNDLTFNESLAEFVKYLQLEDQNISFNWYYDFQYWV